MKKNKRPSKTAMNSRLISRPIRRCFAVFMLPTFAAFCIGFIWPFFQGMYLSFCRFTLPQDAVFVGFENYTKALSDPGFRHAFVYTAGFSIISILAINVFSFIIAYLLTQNIAGSNIFRTVFFMPNLIGGIVLGYIWSMIFDGILKRYGTYLLAETKYGFWGLVILMCWQQIGYMMIVYIAGLQSIGEDMLEAAKIDGATKLQTLVKVIIPNVMSSITICVFLTLTNSFKLFDQNLALTEGMPVAVQADGSMINTTEMLALNIFKTFYASANSRGVAQAKAVMFFILVAVLAMAQLKFTREKEVQS
ncbi:MAG: carbohydrate ABC transporter permease [Oliverpabstia sp.]